MMPLLAIVALAVFVGMPFALVRFDPASKWGAIGCSTILTPFLFLGATKLVALAYWAMFPGSGSGCSGGECGGEAYAAGLWPLLIPVFMVPAFVVSMVIILLMRSARK